MRIFQVLNKWVRLRAGLVGCCCAQPRELTKREAHRQIGGFSERTRGTSSPLPLFGICRIMKVRVRVLSVAATRKAEHAAHQPGVHPADKWLINQIHYFVLVKLLVQACILFIFFLFWFKNIFSTIHIIYFYHFAWKP